MVKFSKELEAQLIPEWKEAFVNYRQLKKYIKNIKLKRLLNQSQPPQQTFGRSIFDSLRFVINKLYNSHNDNNMQDFIQVKKTITEESEEVYETELAQLFVEEDEVQVFFAKLDGELNKVNQFYKKQEIEFVERGEILNKQLNILLDLKQLLNSEVSEMDEVISTLERNGLSFVNSAMRVKTKKGKPQTAIRIDIPATTPTAVTSMLWEDLVNSPMKAAGCGGEVFNKRKIQCAEKMIRSAFVELYKGLDLLKTYSTALRHRDAFLMCTTLMTTVFGAMVMHLLLRAAGFSPSQVDAIPGILFLFFVGLLICPFDIFYRPTRFCFIRVIRNIACSPFYKIPLLRHLETTGCHTFARVFKSHHPETCHSGRLYVEITYLISFLPYWWRALQCARRWFDDNDINHLANMGKYVSAMVAAGARVTYGRQDNNLWFAIVFITSGVATVYQLYWDFVKDWGFFNPNSKNPLLRDDLILKNKSIYYMSIALNVVLRVAWVETITHLNVGPVQRRLLDFFLASLEVIRRGHWNFYRLENEHLNNVGHFRAVKAVPLPFRDIDSDN
ncbi:Phosphate transporter [Vigna angularis]|uniref:Phosphate transporter n=1 Tax=Phaseolus angularis TaxID=3914 RepID=A0A8T0KUN9_PHAAN|nr:Phosphate transporter [Vigna angularis]